MLRITVRFPLGVYHAQSVESFDVPEWPPHPLRLFAALLAAAHGRPGAQPAADRALLQRISEAGAPTIVAPQSIGLDEPPDEEAVSRLRGATRWAPRNYFTRDKGRIPASVSKVGVAIGDRPVHVIWSALNLEPSDLERMALLGSEVNFLGTTRSPVLVEVGDEPPAEQREDAWVPSPPDTAAPTVVLRLSDRATIARFDQRHDARKSNSGTVQSAGLVPGIRIGRNVSYAHEAELREMARSFDPRWWGPMLILGIDRANSDIIPRAAAGYLLARAVRVALLGAYEDSGKGGEAPLVLVGRGHQPHCAVVPLAAVSGPHPDGQVKGVAVILPHADRLPDLPEQQHRIEAGVLQLATGESARPRRYVQIPGAGHVWLEYPDAARARLTTLRAASYRGPSRHWTTATPIVHSRWKKGGSSALLDQVTADCAHVGLPAPEAVAHLRGSGLGSEPVPIDQVPRAWRGPLNGPRSRLRLTFPCPVHGPILLGRARHFGLGLLVPDDRSSGRDIAPSP